MHNDTPADPQPVTSPPGCSWSSLLAGVWPIIPSPLRIAFYLLFGLYTAYTTTGHVTKDYYLIGKVTAYQAGEDPTATWRSAPNHTIRHSVYSQALTNRRGEFILPLHLSALPFGSIPLTLTLDDGDDDTYHRPPLMHPKWQLLLTSSASTTFYHLPDNAFSSRQAYFATEKEAADHYRDHVAPSISSAAPPVVPQHPGSGGIVRLPSFEAPLLATSGSDDPPLRLRLHSLELPSLESDIVAYVDVAGDTIRSPLHVYQSRSSAVSMGPQRSNAALRYADIPVFPNDTVTVSILRRRLFAFLDSEIATCHVSVNAATIAQIDSVTCSSQAHGDPVLSFEVMPALQLRFASRRVPDGGYSTFIWLDVARSHVDSIDSVTYNIPILANSDMPADRKRTEITEPLIDPSNYYMFWRRRLYTSVPSAVATVTLKSGSTWEGNAQPLPEDQEPTTPGGYYARGRLLALSEAPADLDNALDQFQEAVDADEKFALAVTERADIFILQGELARGITEYDNAIGIAPEDAEVHNHYAWALAHAEGVGDAELRRSEELALKSIRLSDGPAARDTLGWIQRKLRKYDEAIVNLNKAAEQHIGQHGDRSSSLPSWQTIQYHLGQVYADAGRTDDAIAAFEQVTAFASAQPQSSIDEYLNEAEAWILENREER